MSKKRNKHLIASEEYEKKHKEIKDFKDNYNGWAGSSAGWPWFKGWIGKMRMEFNNSCFLGCSKFIVIPLLLFILVLIGKSCT